MQKETLNWLGELAIIHTDGHKTDGKYCLIELFATKEGNPPWHIHRNEDEGFYIIEGELTLYVGDEIFKAKSGDFFLAPKNIPHKYTVDSPGHARVLISCSPAGFEDCVRAMSTPVDSLELLTPDEADMDFGRIADIAARYGVEFLDENEISSGS